MDFRGRAYVIPPYLSHLGNDLSRGLLLFATKKPLGKRGLAWLKVHLANVYGKDKFDCIINMILMILHFVAMRGLHYVQHFRLRYHAVIVRRLVVILYLLECRLRSEKHSRMST